MSKETEIVCDGLLWYHGERRLERANVTVKLTNNIITGYSHRAPNLKEYEELPDPLIPIVTVKPKPSLS